VLLQFISYTAKRYKTLLSWKYSIQVLDITFPNNFGNTKESRETLIAFDE